MPKKLTERARLYQEKLAARDALRHAENAVIAAEVREILADLSDWDLTAQAHYIDGKIVGICMTPAQARLLLDLMDELHEE